MANGRKNLIFSSLSFIEDNFIQILLVSICFFFLVSYLVLNNVEFPSDNAHVQRVVVMETFKDKNAALKQAQSQQAFRKLKDLNSCSKAKLTSLSEKEIEEELNKENKFCLGLGNKNVCTKSMCCIWAKAAGKSLCLGGDKEGPTKNPPNLKIDEYYYLDNPVYKVN